MIQERKYDILKHLNLKLTTDGGADPYRHGQDVISFASFDINEKMLKEASETPVGKDEYIFLCEEELEELLQRKNEEKQNEK